MRFAITLGLFTVLAAHVCADNADGTPANFVWLSNEAYVHSRKGNDIYKYEDYESGDCVNVRKIFDTSDTSIFTRGMAVKLCANRNCKGCFQTTEKTAEDADPILVTHAIRSFYVVDNDES
ncbi:hypothetical protein IWW38_004743 [Coemansia aciculifera]|uniref:Uncharacterized protein n=1 Tax=Coemansia aciculifera TaxID=417176 RepID=A0ACC1LX44_9FUNG|nr:hypothetical protein IWW38_004743 [Coemansia aciculifera]